MITQDWIIGGARAAYDKRPVKVSFHPHPPNYVLKLPSFLEMANFELGGGGYENTYWILGVIF